MSKVVKINTQKENVSWQEAMNEFILVKKSAGLSETTIKDYSSHIKMFFNRYSSSWNLHVKKAIVDYMADDIKPATYNLRLIYLRTFFQFCVEEGYLPENPLQNFKKRKAEGRIVDIPEGTLKKLLGLPDQSTFAGLRDYALILLTLDTGIRPNEAFQLKESDFDLKHNSVNIRCDVSKTGLSRSLPILPSTSKTVRKLISSKHPEWNNDTPVFCTTEGQPMNRHTWNNRMKFYSQQLDFKVRPYDLRHCFALLFLRNGGNAFALQTTLGHTDIQMTKRYINLTGQDLRDTHLSASPLNKLLSQPHKRVRKIF